MVTDDASTTSVYIAAAEGNTGKSTVALGVLRLLAGSVQRVGVFRPVAYAQRDQDFILDLLREHATVELEAEECVGTTYEAVHADPDAAIAEIVDRYHAVAEQCDAVVVLGTDYTDIPTPTEFAFNARIAVNLGAPVLLVVSGHDRSEAEISQHVRLTLRDLRDGRAHPVAVIVNRCEPAALENIVGVLTAYELPVWALPEVPVLFAPTMAELQKAMGADLHAGDPELLGREALDVIVGGMTGENILQRLTDGCCVVVPADRTDVVLAVLTAHGAEGFPSMAGMVWNGGLRPHPMVAKLIDGMGSSLPILTTDGGTFETAAAAARTRGRFSTHSHRKIETAMSLAEVHIEGAALLRLLQVRIPSVVTPQMFEHRLVEQARSDRRHIVLPEGEDDRVLRAADRLLRRRVANLTILGDIPAIRRRADELGLDISGASLHDPRRSSHLDEFACEYERLRAHKGMTYDRAVEQMHDISYFATMMVHLGHADGMVSGAAHTTAHTIRPSFEIIKTRPGVSTVSSIFLMCLADRVLAYGDCAVVPDPTAEQLADIAISSAETAAQFGIEPRVAMLSYSTGTSGSGADVEKVREATARVHVAAPDLLVEGPIQYDAAVEPTVAASKMPDSPVAGRATVLIFPDLNTGNNTYKAVQRTAGAVAIGPVLQGLNKPINDLSRGALVSDIVNTVAITAIQAQGGQDR